MKIAQKGPSPIVFAHAKSFYKAAQAIPKYEISPYLVNLGFALELLFKSILVEFEYQWGGAHYKCKSLIRDQSHDLLALFKKLPEFERKEIVNRYRKNTGRKIEPDLKPFRSVFLDQRYAFEKLPKGIKTAPLEKITETVFAFTRELIGSAYRDADDYEKRP